MRCYAGEDRTLGIGAGQMSRVDASRIAVWKAGKRSSHLRHFVAATRFFPFPVWSDGGSRSGRDGGDSAGRVRCVTRKVIAAADRAECGDGFSRACGISDTDRRQSRGEISLRFYQPINQGNLRETNCGDDCSRQTLREAAIHSGRFAQPELQLE